MKFSEIIREAGFNPKNFSEASKSDVTLYGDDDFNVFNAEEIVDDNTTINFTENLFAETPAEKEKFHHFLKELEASPVDSFNMRIDENSVIVFYKTPHPQTFLRKDPMDPIDYMD